MTYHHLIYEQRCQIYALKKRGFSSRAIACDIGVHHSTVCRELTRNTGCRGYRYKQAHRLSKQRLTAHNIKMDAELVLMIEEKLFLQWSPGQISGWLKRHNHARISYETIYQHVWRDKKNGGHLYKHLRRRGKKYNKRSGINAGRGCIPGRIDIDQRPAIVEKKHRIGDWELDTIIGAHHKGAIVSMVDRASKLTKLVKVAGKTADRVNKALLYALGPVKQWVLTLTSDNGKEFSGHKDVSEKLQAGFYFAKPYRSWERGLNEHTNGLVRQYFPKCTNLLEISETALRKVENLLNNRPRAVLNFQTPNEVFMAKTKEPPTVALQT